MADPLNIFSEIFMESFKEAMRQNNQCLVNELLLQGSVYQSDKFGNTFLHAAVIIGSLDTVTVLCNLGADIYALNKDKKTPLFYAIKSSVDIVKILLSNREISDWCLLRQAIIFGSEEVVKFFVNNLPLYINKNFPTECIFNRSLRLSKIVKYDKIEDILKLLLQLQKYVSREYLDYPLLIFFAAKIANKHILQLVLEDCEKYLEESIGFTKPLIERNVERDETQNRFLPYELNFQGSFCETALHYAVSLQLSEVVLFLLQEGADPNCKTRSGLTPLHYASYLGNENICSILLNFGAQVNPNSCQTNFGLILHSDCPSNPLHLVCGEWTTREVLNSSWNSYCKELHDSNFLPGPVFDRKILKLLLSYGANPKISGHNGFNPFFEACRTGRWKEMKIFLEFLTDVYAYDIEENTALHLAAIDGAFETVDLLLAKGIDVNVKNYLGYTPLMYYITNVKNPCSKMIKLFAYHGANLNDRSNEGWTVLQMAASFNNPEAVLTLLELGDKELWNLSPDSHTQGLVSSSWSTGGQGLEVLLSFISLREDKIGNYIKCFIKPSHFNKASTYFEKSKLEQEELRKAIVVHRRNISYYNILTWNFSTLVRVIKIAKLRNELTYFSNVSLKFPCYALLINRRLSRIKSLEASVDKAIDFFMNFGEKNLPCLVIEKILSYLSCRDFQVFGNVL
ncbi:ankyrin-3-like [Leptopilina heterotoma]|uniref:ankyrin-3-like n=1 Tax=Leptopilina heterotoma TaxID=63436 RepID=UPI001CA86B35|nr:ankyrin-3-like [Leptopilina heterotoma]XP_043476378.1 ankyrin-3-like [Leptopilina heterotoma]XP_043476379.1 ankyrin-3-like [Leptopilina heterotoma]XP_043476381.1 ankyrin-3-like [Leptopilina heterotoma]XP_043476382.1 ankyrin-3-like [Leptopilina heterotoma]XP_043476383.1 ankyrin-3-like [Leptopilina heterotoma]XP_043476384.1 ankyrin-3-like [Leptopilina heterotoma]XP_043476385.1 ankyrin-3-like [Leptopilina heterotoma]